MAENKLSSEKKVLILVIVLFAIIASLSVVSYLSSFKNTLPITVQFTVQSTPTLEPTITPTPESTTTTTPEPTEISTSVLIPASTDSFEYGKNDQVFSLTKNKFNVLKEFNLSEFISDGCANKSEQYYRQLLSNYSKDDFGTEYHFTYKEQASRDWVVTVIPNKIGYANLKDFKNDFDICAAGASKYPSLVSEKYLLFIMSCGSGGPDPYAVGCDLVREIVEPTIKLK